MADVESDYERPVYLCVLVCSKCQRKVGDVWRQHTGHYWFRGPVPVEGRTAHLMREQGAVGRQGVPGAMFGVRSAMNGEPWPSETYCPKHGRISLDQGTVLAVVARAKPGKHPPRIAL